MLNFLQCVAWGEVMSTEQVDSILVALPEWTEYNRKNGLDPLGMQNSSVNLYQKLLPGISNVTLRMRYYGLYAWLCRAYAKTDGSNDPERWKKFVRRAEALYALISYRAGNQGGVAGIQWAEKTYENAPDEDIDFATAADPDSESKYLKQAWGAYGAAYGSQLFAIGIFWESPDHILPVPSNTFGDRFARILEDELGEHASLFLELIARGSASKKQIDRLAPIVPSEIPIAGNERALYQDLLLTVQDRDGLNASSRRSTLLLVLKVSALLKCKPSSEQVRWVLYANQDQEGRGLELKDSALEEQRQRWWVYQVNELCHIALGTLLKFTLDTLGNHSTGLPIKQLISECVDQILEVAVPAPKSWVALLKSTVIATNSYDESSELSEFRFCTDIMRGVGRRNESSCSPEIAWKAVQLLAILHKRVRDEEYPVESELGGFDSEAFQTILTETRFFEEHAVIPFRDILGKIIELKIVRRHLWVAARKFRSGDYTFLIESDEGRLRLREKDGPAFTNPRLAPAITFLKDIHLIGDKGLTDYGEEAVIAS